MRCARRVLQRADALYRRVNTWSAVGAAFNIQNRRVDYLEKHVVSIIKYVQYYNLCIIQLVIFFRSSLHVTSMGEGQPNISFLYCDIDFSFLAKFFILAICCLCVSILL